ncbi:MAG TPA: hypothetical protein VNY09_06570 [Candidatus Sulfotelmatobacter sp.]|jgi:hypothetical protein|nr:hypothetical protein [Candidatus Sulfotelmatobacter sp.]
MNPVRTQIHFLPSHRSVLRAFRTGVSLHSHTELSQEELSGLPRHLERMPVVSHFLHREMERYRAKTGQPVDFSRAYWRGPLDAHSAHELERHQIELLDLPAIVSLTDHDNIEAGLQLRADGIVADAPVSVEWTVPFEPTYFHVGIHNMAADRAPSLMQRMASYTREPSAQALGELLEELDADPNILIVFNHPLWDMRGIGHRPTVAAADCFLHAYGQRLHALEINGLRCWRENLGVVHLAQESGHPVVSGGDRHGLEPNATINLTRAVNFAQFAREIREERTSDIAILPQYGEPLYLRHLLTAWDAVREHPQLERQRWIARVFVRCEDGIERPLSHIWTEGAPRWIDPCLNVIGLLASTPMRTVGRLANLADVSVML